MTTVSRPNLFKKNSSPIPSSICDSPQTRRFSVWNGPEIRRCPVCHLLFVLGGPSQEALVSMYGDNELPQERLETGSTDESEPPAWKMKEHARLWISSTNGGQGMARFSMLVASAVSSCTMAGFVNLTLWESSPTQMRFPRSETFTKPAIVQEERSEEHTSELQSQSNIVCRLLLEKKNRQAIRQ